MKYAVVFTTCMACLIGFKGGSAHERSQHNVSATNERNPVGGESLYQLNSHWTDQDGKLTTLGHFQGKPLILAMIYTSCKDTCPMIVLDMQTIEKALPERVREQVRFALISFDPERDSPEELRRFESAHGLDTKHWTLLTGSDNSVRMLAAALGIRYVKVPTGEFAHSSVITVLDSQGNIQHQQAGLRKDPGEVVTVVSRLLGAAK